MFKKTGIFITVAVIIMTGAAYAATADLPETGQDVELQKGVAWPNPRFTASADTTVTDNLTGLIWTPNGGTPTVGSCLGGTKLWQAATDYVACLNTNSYLGHSDWRLPNVNELESLVNIEKSNSATWLNTQGFNNVQANLYWSFTTDAYYTRNAWIVGMWGGYVGLVNRSSYYYYAWPVRSRQ